MIDHELTDPAGGALTITHDHQGVWITATEGRDEVTVGPFPVTSLTEAVTVESDAEVSGDLMDGGVTAAAIEAEVVSPERARSLVQERDELAEALDTTMGRAIKAERERDELRAAVVELAPAPTASPRPLTADDITDEMVQRGDQAWSALRNPENTFPRLIVETIIRAALTPPPARPEGAEEIEAELVAFEDTDMAHTMQAQADFLAERGVRAGGDR